MKLTFIPLDYDYISIRGKTYMKIFGKTSEGKSCCIIDKTSNFFYVLTGKPENLLPKIQKIKDVEKAEILEKNYKEKPVKPIRVFSEYNKMQDIAHKIEKFDKKAETRERDINQITRYIIEKKFKPLIWYEIEGNILDSEELGGLSNSIDTDFVIKLEKIKQAENQPDFKPKVLAFDIEAEEFEIGKGEILMISLFSENFQKVLTWKKCEKKQNYVECFNSEADMIEAFASYIKKIKPDIITGYFSDGFDLPYLRARAEKNNIDLRLGIDGSRILFSKGRPLNARIKGIIHIDLLKFIETVYSQYLQSETLSLNEVSSELLGEKKLEIDHDKKSEDREEKDWRNYFEYNLKDSELTFKLFQKLWPDMIEFSKIIQEPLFSINRYSLSHLMENYFIHNLEKFNEIAEKRPVYEEIEKRKMREKYEGAFVFQPEANLYEDLAVFDFTSYWPSIIVTFNLSSTTFLGEKKSEKDALEVQVREKKLYFSKKPGFFPLTLKEIIELRKKYKQEYSKNKNPITKARSNAYKLLANASYGYQGFFGARWYCPEASASTTAISRDFTKKIISSLNKEDYSVIYSDSVDGKTKVIIKRKEEISEINIKDLFEKAEKSNSEGKEYNFKKDIEVLTLDEYGNSVFIPINYVMRHKCDKKMYRINFTNNWNIDVTEDHSLMGYQSYNLNQSRENKTNPLKRIIEVKPTEIKKKANTIISLKNIPYKNSETKNYPKKVYEFMGYFIGDGSFRRNKSNQIYNKDYYLGLSLGLDKQELMDKLIEPLKKQGYIKNFWLSKTREGDLMINGLKLVNLISKSLRDNKGKKTIPQWLFKEKEENIASFLRGLFSADGCVMIRNNAPIIKYTSVEKNYIKEVRKLLYRLGISHSIFRENSVNKYKTKNKIFCNGTYSKNIIIKDRKSFIEKIGFIQDRKNKLAGIITKGLQRKYIKNYEFDIQAVKSIEQIKTPKYVYDIEVKDNHRFFANYVLVHNTDSIAFILNKHSKQEALNQLKKLNESLPGIMELELEDFYKRGIWVTKRTGEFGAKKKYALINYEGKLKIRGFETVRRDWCFLARNLQNKVLEKILKNGDEKEALNYSKEIIRRIKKREIDKKELIIKTQLKKPLSEYISEGPHVAIAKKMLKLGMPVDMGMIISYYISESKEKKSLIRERAKLLDEKGEYDVSYYLNNQILPAIENIFEVFNVNIKEIIEGSRQKKLF